MRPLLLVATALLMFAVVAGTPAADAQGTSTLTVTLCAQPDYDYEPKPMGTFCEGRGLPGATVRLTRDGPLGNGVGAVDKTATTDADGVARFDTLADGAYQLQMSRTGFASKTADVTVRGATTAEYTVAGAPVEFQGVVKDAAGKPVAEARVSLCCDRDGSKEPAATGADGFFRIPTTAGFRMVTVHDAPGFIPLSEERLVDGSRQDVTLERVPPPDARIHGIVRDQDGKPVAGLRIDAYPSYCCAEPEPAATSPPSSMPPRPDYTYYPNHTRTQSDGSYSMHVHGGGRIALSVQQADYAALQQEVDVPKGATVEADLAVKRLPPRDARVEGRITDPSGNGLGAVSVTISHPESGRTEHGGAWCDQRPMPVEPTTADEPATASSGSSMSIWPGPGCTIQVAADGTFTGMATPGYSIVTVYHACTEGDCQDGYYPAVRTLVLKSGTQRLDLTLVPRPGPDATLSGYLVDDPKDAAILAKGARIDLYNLDNGAWGTATLDGEGSYKVRLRSGLHQVTAHADGYLRWEGTVFIEEGANTLDIRMTPGQDAGGGCCWRAASDHGKTMAATGPNEAGASSGAMPPSPDERDAMEESATAFQDLKGGLGPYDPDNRPAQAGTTRDSPALPLVVLLGLGVAVALVRRRAD